MAADYYHEKEYVDSAACTKRFQGRIHYAVELSDGGNNLNYASTSCDVCIHAEIFCGRNCDNRNKRMKCLCPERHER